MQSRTLVEFSLWRTKLLRFSAVLCCVEISAEFAKHISLFRRSAREKRLNSHRTTHLLSFLGYRKHETERETHDDDELECQWARDAIVVYVV